MNATTAPARGRERTVHLNTAGRGRMSAAVRAAVTDCALREDRYGPHETEETLGDVLHGGVQARIGTLLGGVPAAHSEVVTSASAAFDALVGTLVLRAGDRIWTTPYESPARLATLYALRDRARCRLDVVPLRDDGDLDLEWMAERIDDSVALVSVVHVPSALGIVNPVEEVGRILAPHRCLYAVDASYSVGQSPVDAARIGCDLLTADGWRFLRGPDSVGLAYVTPRLATAARRDGDPRRGVSAPENAAVVGLDVALADHARTAYDTDVHALRRRLRAVVEGVDGMEVVAPGRFQSGILAFHHPELPAARLRRELAAKGVVLWKTVAQEVPGYLPGRGIGTALRASVHVDNTAGDIARFAEALAETVHELTAASRPHRRLAPATLLPAEPPAATTPAAFSAHPAHATAADGTNPPPTRPRLTLVPPHR